MAIPKVFDQPGAGFVLLPRGKKYPPIEQGWQRKGHSFQETEAYATKGGNVGLIAGNGRLGFDQDEPAAFEGLELPDTTKWETRPGRFGLSFTASDVAEVLEALGKKPDLAQFYLFKDGEQIGEIKLQRSYQAIPPSWKFLEDGSRADYRLMSDVPPATISLNWLIGEIKRLGIAVGERENTLEKNAVKLENIVQESRQKRVETDEKRARKYAEAALDSEVAILTGTREGARNDQLNKSVFALAQFVAAGILSESEVTRALSRAAEHTGLERDEIERTIRSGLEAGSRHPREIPKHEDRYEPKKDDTPKVEEVHENIHTKALEVLQHGDPVDFILKVLATYHAGDSQSAEMLLCSVAIGSVLNANGTQPKLSGGSGKGKTHLCKALRHLMPPEWVLFTSLSPKAIYYDPSIKPGMVIFSDDVRISEDLEDTLKRAMSNFQEPSPYRVVNKDKSLETRYLPERLIWWLTSVQDDQEEQLVNRFFSVGIDESKAQDIASLRLTFMPLAEGRREFPITVDVHICREIIRILKSKTWMVRAPFLMDSEGNLNVAWQTPEDRRNPGRFVDLLAAYAILRSGQRQTEDQSDYTVVVATPEDFKAAKKLYESRAENLATKLTDRELHFIRWLKEKASKSVYEFKINDVSKEYRGTDGKGLSPKSLERMLLGRKDRNSYGLIDKIKGGCLTVEARSDTEPINGSETRKRQFRYNLFAFDPSKFNLLESYGSAVSLKSDNSKQDPNGPRKDPRDGSGPVDPIDIDNDKKNDEEDPLDPMGTQKACVLLETEKSSLSLKVGSFGSNGTNGETDAESCGSDPGSDWGSDGKQAEEPKTGKIDRATPTLTPSQKSTLWSGAGRLIKKNHCRVNKNRKGFTAEDLQKETELQAEDIRAALEAAGWPKSHEPCGTIFWAPEKTLKAFGERV